MGEEPDATKLVQTSGVAVSRGADFSVRLPDLALQAGDALAIVGPSGCGKTTALMALAGIRPPQSGKIEIDGIDPWDLRPGERDRFRGRRIGLIFQSFHLVDALSVSANIRLASPTSRYTKDGAERFNRLVSELDLGTVLSQRADRISHGQAQRVAIARALFNKPAVILADEPTSALDDARTESLLRLLTAMAATEGAALIVTTHDRRVLQTVSHVVRLEAAS